MSSHLVSQACLILFTRIYLFPSQFLTLPASCIPNQTLLLTGLTFPQTLMTLAKNSGTMTKYPTWYRTLMRRAKEEEMKRFCKAQVRPG